MLVREWVRDPMIQVQVESPVALQRLGFLDRDDAGVVGALGRRGPGRVAVAQGIGDPDRNASVWVAANHTGYKSAYFAFLSRVYAIDASSHRLPGYDIDHLLNRARSPQGLSMIRIEAVPSDANQAWGRLFEKAASDPRFYANQNRERRTMSWIICAKLAGQMPPLGPNDTAGINRLANFFAPLGIPTAETRAGLSSILDFAYKFR